jgi:O-antigen ligase
LFRTINTTWCQILTYALLFLFPIAGNSLKSWTGIIFGLLFIAAVFFSKSVLTRLSVQEKILVWIMVSIFLITVGSNLANGWEYEQTRGLGIYARWLLVVPIFWLVRAHPQSFFWLANGSTFASVVLFLQAIYDLYILNFPRAYGVYNSPGLIGLQSLVFVIILIGAIKIYHPNRVLVAFYGLGCTAGLASLILSGSRSTYLTLVLLLPCVLFILFKWKKALGILGLCGFCAGLVFMSSDFVANRVESGLKEAKTYLDNPNPAVVDHASVGARLEMWKAALLIAKEKPLLGAGWRNFQENTKPFVERGAVSVSASQHPHPHSMYFESLVTMGALGLFFTLALFIHSARTGLQSKTLNSVPGRLLIVFTLAFALNGINEGGALVYGNALSFFLIYLIVLFSFAHPASAPYNPRRVDH